MKAAIFDMDGTLLCSMDLARELNLTYIAAQGVTLTEEQRRTLRNLTIAAAVSFVQREFGVNIDYEALRSNTRAGMLAHYKSGLPTKSGAIAYLKRLRARGVKCVVATNTRASSALVALNQSGLTPHLDYIVSTEMIGLEKNSVAFFDALCAMIGEDKRDCVMFEDSLYAMQGAREAGLGVIGITDSTNELTRAQMQEICDRVIDSYDELE